MPFGPSSNKVAKAIKDDCKNPAEQEQLINVGAHRQALESMATCTSLQVTKSSFVTLFLFSYF